MDLTLSSYYCGNLTIMDSSHRYKYRDFAARGARSLSVLYEVYETSYLFYVTLSFLCNIICYLISVFVFSLETLSGATTVIKLKKKVHTLYQSACFIFFFFCQEMVKKSP